MEQRVKISSLDTAQLTCPQCRSDKALQLSDYKLIKRNTRVKYTRRCGHTYIAVLERRSGSGKGTHLPGIDLNVEFVLDDAKQSVVTKEVRVLARNGRYLTAEFLSKEHFDNLGPYLFFNKLYV